MSSSHKEFIQSVSANNKRKMEDEAAGNVSAAPLEQAALPASVSSRTILRILRRPVLHRTQPVEAPTVALAASAYLVELAHSSAEMKEEGDDVEDANLTKKARRACPIRPANSPETGPLAAMPTFNLNDDSSEIKMDFTFSLQADLDALNLEEAAEQAVPSSYRYK
ncbi:MAG: hypothetical protein P4M14_07325 [Gammaproteobacteria bacterium]|nr:hypothetical protein [Gammaproteobacteria bacterium]